MTTELHYPIKHMKIPLTVGEASMLNFTVITLKWVEKMNCQSQLLKRETYNNKNRPRKYVDAFLNKEQNSPLIALHFNAPSLK